jgi:PKD repeat protein
VKNIIILLILITELIFCNAGAQGIINTNIDNFNKKNSEIGNDELIIIPTVVHILHDYGVENISDLQVNSAIDFINKSFRKTSPDTVFIIPHFKPIAADTKIEFRLALLDPNGNCTNGIDRIASVKTYSGNDCSKTNLWDPSKYYNIWVVKNLEKSGIAMYSYSPDYIAENNLYDKDGLMILHSYFGTMGTSSISLREDIIPFLATSLGLKRSMGFFNECIDDGVDDTPPSANWAICPTATPPLYLEWVNCSLPNDTIIENVNNFMNFNYCGCMFTNGQKEKMRTLLNSSTCNRNQLISQENLINSGVLQSNSNCSPIADFKNPKVVCANTPINFTSLYSENGLNYSWTFEDGSPATSDLQNPTISFLSMGWKTISLTVSNNQGSNTKTKPFGIYVTNSQNEINDSTLLTLDGNLNSSGFVSINPEQNSSQFQGFILNNQQNNFCIGLNNYSICSDRDIILFPDLDLSNKTATKLSFKYSGSSRCDNNNIESDFIDYFSISYSKDCGLTWLTNQSNSVSGDLLANAGYHNQEYFPENETDWKLYSFYFPSSFNNNIVKVMLQYHNTGNCSNNFFIDDVKLSYILEDKSYNPYKQIKLFPNPIKPSDSEINFDFENKQNIKSIALVNSLGLVLNENLNWNTVENSIDLHSINNLSRGFYYIRFLLNDDSISIHKIIVL